MIMRTLNPHSRVELPDPPPNSVTPHLTRTPNRRDNSDKVGQKAKKNVFSQAGRTFSCIAESQAVDFEKWYAARPAVSQETGIIFGDHDSLWTKFKD